MSDYILWFLVGFGLLAAELATGTFYLLVLAVAMGTAGVAALLGAPLALQLLVAAVVGTGGSLWLRRSRTGRPAVADAADSMQNMDIGQTLRIDRWTDRSARADYRGAQWDVELASGEEPAPGDYVIRDIQANRLIVAARR
jgi:membrane protein implicated in regulation of membrane protease activity